MTVPANSKGHKPYGEHGYALLCLLLIIALLAIAAGIAAPTLAFQIKRDREEELIHRGVQYTRAIREFVKKTGRYPSRVDELLNFGGTVGGTRFLRRRYTDPVTNKDFKLLTLEDVMKAEGQMAPPVASWEPSSGPGTAALPSAGTQEAQAGNTNPTPDQTSPDATGPAASNSLNSGVGAQNTTGFPGAGVAGASGAQSGQVIGGVIVGVASSCKDATIREFNHKKHYNEWLFFYQPSVDPPYPLKGPTPLTPPAAALLPGAQGLQSQSPGSQSPQFGSQTAPQQPSSPQ
jgi:type II secretory pathway pseudopilin PulG